MNKALVLAALAATACVSNPRPALVADPASLVDSADVHRQLFALADDSMQGRATATPGAARAARFIADEMRRAGLEPAGDSGYFQRVPLTVRRIERMGRDSVRRPIEVLQLLPGFVDWDSIPEGRRRLGINVVGVLRGSDKSLRDTSVLIDAHYDHLPMRASANGDSIYNGADDDASGVVTVLQVAKALARATPRPKRTLVFAATTGEEMGLLGTRWYILHPATPLARMSANLEVEMIGRPDSLAGGRDRAWLTGYERSTMGDMLKAAGIPIVADARPCEGFFQRSDNIAFARMGIPAHTLSTYNMHSDYHMVSDEPDRADIGHMTAVIRAAVNAARLLADGPAPKWHEGMRPPAQGRLPLPSGCASR